MPDFLSYDLARGLHIVPFVAWMAGLLMLPRLYAYQTGAAPGGELDLKMREGAARLRRIILTPALVATWIFGLYLLSLITSNFTRLDTIRTWLAVKLVLVVLLSGLHGWLVANGKKLARGERPRSEKFWRLMNEVPFIIAIVVILLATAEPMLPL